MYTKERDGRSTINGESNDGGVEKDANHVGEQDGTVNVITLQIGKLAWE